jgi:protease IV
MRPSRVLGLFLLVSCSSFGQTLNVVHNDLDRGLTLPPTSAAFADEATSSILNPAGLTYVERLQLFWVHERSLAKDRVSDGIYVGDTFFKAFGVGYNHEWIRPSTGPGFRKFSWAFSLGGPWASIGTSVNWFRSEIDADINGLQSVDVGLLVRPTRSLSLGVVAKNVDQPSQGAMTLQRRYNIALGIRPFGERLSLGADLLFNETTGVRGGRLGYTLNAELLRGFIVNAGLAHGLSGGGGVQFQVGLTLNSPLSGIAYAMGGGSGTGVDHVVQVRLSQEKYRSLPVRERRLAYWDLPERLSPARSTAMTLLGVEAEDPFIRLMSDLDAASRDPRLAGVVLKFEVLPDLGLGKAEELRGALLRLRTAGKRVVAVLFTSSDAEYWAASAADKIYAVPDALLAIDGFAANATFLGGAMQKLGIDFDVARVGAYKNAPDMFTRTGMSKEQRETIDAYLDSGFRAYQAALRQGRGLTDERLKAVLAEGLLPPQRAKQLGVIDEVMAPQDVEEAVEALVPNGRFVRTYDPRDVREGRWGMKKRIAIIPIVGDITGGKSRRDPFGITQMAGSETVVHALDVARRDPTISAIVLRVDSRGGSSLASDLMYRAVLEAKKRKPIVASMGDYAASGGYYAAMGADEVFCTTPTLTGSIGVFILKPAAEKLAEKLGIHRETVLRGPLSNIFDLVKPWGDAERAAAQKWVDASYDNFITEVSKSRRQDKTAVDALARGRVWAGEDAKAKGLVDHQGGLLEAVEAAKRRASLSVDEDVEWVILSEPKGPLAELTTGEGVVARLTAGMTPPSPGIPEAWKKAALELGFDPMLIAEPDAKAMLPFSLRVR